MTAPVSPVRPLAGKPEILVQGHTFHCAALYGSDAKLGATTLRNYEVIDTGAEPVHAMLGLCGHTLLTGRIVPLTLRGAGPRVARYQLMTLEWLGKEKEERLRIRTLEEIANHHTDDNTWQPVQKYAPKDKPDNAKDLIVYLSVDVATLCALHGTGEFKRGSIYDWLWEKTGNAHAVVLQIANSNEPGDVGVVGRLLDTLIRTLKARTECLVIVTNQRFLSSVKLPITEDRSWEAFEEDCCTAIQIASDPKNTGNGVAVRALLLAHHLIIRKEAFAAVQYTLAGGAIVARRIHYLVATDQQIITSGGFLIGHNSLYGTSVVDALADPALSAASFDDRLAHGITNAILRCTAFESTGYTVDPKNCRIRSLADAFIRKPDGHVRRIDLNLLDPSLRMDDIRRPSIMDYIIKGCVPYSTDPSPVAGVAWAGEKTHAEAMALAIVIAGVRMAMRMYGLPCVKFGEYRVIDRSTFEEMWEIQAAIRSYLGKFRGAKLQPPLCFGIFGAPGGGKSFGVKQIAKSLAGEALGEILEVNVAQYQRPEDLAWVFKKVRDGALENKLPLVLFDEFDSSLGDRPFGWLKSFLAPMQDGAYGGGPDPIAFRHGIFGFIGGLNTTFDMFAGRMRNAQFIEAKGPDFISRLSRHLNIRGISAPEEVDGDGDGLKYILRRAEMLRTFLWWYHKPLFRDGENGPARIEPDVVRALLIVPKYYHGSRSLEAIVRGARLDPDRPWFRWASLAPRSQLGMHVDVSELEAARTPY